MIPVLLEGVLSGGCRLVGRTPERSQWPEETRIGNMMDLRVRYRISKDILYTGLPFLTHPLIPSLPRQRGETTARFN
jgi:hypothetical protein